MNELAYHCTIYFKAEQDETMKEAANRLERILANEGLDFQYYDLELQDEDGNIIDSED